MVKKVKDSKEKLKFEYIEKERGTILNFPKKWKISDEKKIIMALNIIDTCAIENLANHFVDYLNLILIRKTMEADEKKKPVNDDFSPEAA